MRCLEILFVDGNPGDALPVEEFLRTHCAAKVTATHNGEEALLELLRHEYQPDLIVLDMDFSKWVGQQILMNMRRRIGAKVPIIVMSSSRHPDDVSQAYANGANAYMTKPSELDAFRRMLQSLAQLWIEPLKGNDINSQIK